ncbi:MAG: GNAT family N-acetyltransferase [Bacillota bacterium]
MQFSKSIITEKEMPSNIEIHKGYKRNNEIIEMSEFGYSKFIDDRELAKRGGDQVYRQWVINSFERSDKYYAISKDENDTINGFLLHSYSNTACVIELIAVSKIMTNVGIGTRLFEAVEFSANNKGIKEIIVGTQVRNRNAINFYHKVGCKLVGCHQVYHLWNLKK